MTIDPRDVATARTGWKTPREIEAGCVALDPRLISDHKAADIGAGICVLLGLTPDERGRIETGSLPDGTTYGDRTYAGLSRIIARVFDDPEFLAELIETAHDVWDNIPDEDGITRAQYEAANEATAILDEENAREAENLEEAAYRAAKDAADDQDADGDLVGFAAGDDRKPSFPPPDWDGIHAESNSGNLPTWARSCECGAGRRPDGTFFCADPPGLDVLDAHEASEQLLRDAVEARAENDRRNKWGAADGLYSCLCDGVQYPDTDSCWRCEGRPAIIPSTNIKSLDPDALADDGIENYRGGAGALR